MISTISLNFSSHLQDDVKYRIRPAGKLKIAIYVLLGLAIYFIYSTSIELFIDWTFSKF